MPNITAAELTDKHIGSQISLPHKGEIYAGEFVSVTADVLLNDPRVRVEMIIVSDYCSIYVYPETPVTFV